MASNLFSRVLPQPGSQSVYEAIQQDEEAAELTPLREHADTAIDDQNLGERFTDEDIDHLLAEAAESRISTESPDSPLRRTEPRPLPEGDQTPVDAIGPKWAQPGPPPLRQPHDDMVPDSLLLERADLDASTLSRKDPLPARPSELPSPVPGPVGGNTRVQWNAPSSIRRSRVEDYRKKPARILPGANALLSADPVEKAMYRWTNVENLDNFLGDVYEYFLEKGIWSMMLSRALNHLSQAFVVILTTLLTQCIDYSDLRNARDPFDVIVPQCTKKMPAYFNLLLWLFCFYWFLRLAGHMFDIRRLWQLHEFYTYLLDVPNHEIQTISWQEVVGRLMNLRDANPRTATKMSSQSRKFIGVGQQSKQRMDAHDIANRLMRKDNYLIALFNKDILNLTLPVPFLRNRPLFSKSLEWNVNLAIFQYVFNEQGQVKQAFLKETRRRDLIQGLQRRFRFFAVINVLVAPFIVCFLMLVYFLKYFTEFQKNPSQIGARSYTPLAEWKFREFNEVWHLFERRTNMSYPFASRYIDQFPKDKTVQVARFVAFVTGAISAVLGIASFLDLQAFVVYLGIFGSIYVVSRGMIPEDNLVFDPEYAIQNVIEYTHYRPAHWKGRLHSEEVKNDFSALYQMRILIFTEEMLSIIITPFLLWFSLPLCSERIVDFFREFTIHVDGLGYVCSFALFDFQAGERKAGPDKPASAAPDDNRDLREDYYSTKDGKMLSSYYSFIDSYAHNPRRGVNKQYGKRNFFPPPTFPGLAASAGPAPPARPTPSGTRDVAAPHLARLRQDPRPPSPSMSLLLDPHHQPSQSALRPAAAADNSRRRPHRRQHTLPSTHNLQNVREDSSTMASSVAVDDDSHLGDSWKTTQAAARSGDVDVSDDEDARMEGQGGGVLDLLYQFQKAQNEGRGPGVNI